MSELVIPISKRQSEMVDALHARLNMTVETLAAGADVALPSQLAWRTVTENGVYSLRITIPEVPGRVSEAGSNVT